MAPSVSKEELMRNSDPLVWSLSGGNNTPESEPNRICEKIWVFLNSRVCNIVIVTLVNIETLVIVSKLLITLEVVQDPNWKAPSANNCTINGSTLTAVAEPASQISPKLIDAGVVFSNISTAILTLFLFEIVLRLLTGRFRYITQGTEVFDAILVIIVFSLGVAFLTTPAQTRSGREGVLCIIVLRLWRIKRVFRSITDAAKVELSQVVHTYHREKTQAEHKVDILILKVEDLEHEVAYLKEKLKKTERESVIIKKRRSKEGGSSHGRNQIQVQTPTTTTATIAIATIPAVCPSMATQTGISTEKLIVVSPQKIGYQETVLHIFADRIAEHILLEAIAVLASRPLPVATIIELSSKIPTICDPPKFKPGTKLRRRPDGSLESGYGSGASNINWDRFRGTKMSEEGSPTTKGPMPNAKSVTECPPAQHQMTVIANVTAVSPGGHLGLKCPESSPESGYGSSASAALHQRTSSPIDPAEVTDLSSGSAKLVDTVFLFPDPPKTATQSQQCVVDIQDPAGVELEWLDEQSEIERIKRVEFDPHRKDKGVPMTSL